MPFLTYLGEKTEEVQIWECDPLVVHQPEDGIVYAGRTKAEFTPVKGGYGSIVALSPNSRGWNPEITITDWHDLPDTMILPYRQRPGRILFGHDREGFEFVWYIDRAADEFLTRSPDSPEPVEEP